MRNENALDEIITFINNVIETSKKDSLSMCISEDYERSYVRIGCECENEELQPKEFNIRLITPPVAYLNFVPLMILWRSRIFFPMIFHSLLALSFLRNMKKDKEHIALYPFYNNMCFMYLILL